MANQDMLITLSSLSLKSCSLKTSRKGTLPAESRKWMTGTECISNAASEIFSMEKRTLHSLPQNTHIQASVNWFSSPPLTWF